MTLDEHIRFFDKVKQLRHYQRLYHQFHASADLERVKRLQYEVDKMITNEVREHKSKQINLL